MIQQGALSSSSSYGAASAQIIMSTEDSGIKGSFKSGGDGGKPTLFTADEFDIYCNRVTLDAYIFHGKDVDYDAIDHLEYDHKNHTVDIILTNGMIMDLGVKISWLIRPHFSKAKEVQIIKTKDNQAIEGTVKPLIHKNK